MFKQLFGLSEKWALLLRISVGAEGPVLNIVKELSDCHMWKLFPVPLKGWLIASPGSSHVCFLGSMCNSLAHCGKGSLSSRIALPGSKPMPLLLLINLGDLQRGACFQERWVTPAWKCYCHWKIQQLQSCHGQSLSPLFCQPSGTCLKGAHHVPRQNPVPLAAAADDLACWVLWVNINRISRWKSKVCQ